MTMGPITEIARMGVFYDEIKEFTTTEFIRELPRLRLIYPH